MKVGEYLKLKRQEKNLSLRQIAYKTGLSHTYISDIEKGNLVGTNETHEKIITGLNFTEDEKNFFYTLLMQDKNIPVFITEKIDKLESEIKELKIENEKLRKNNIINNSNTGNIVVGNSSVNSHNSNSNIDSNNISLNSEIDLSGLTDNEIQQLKVFLDFLKSKRTN